MNVSVPAVPTGSGNRNPVTGSIGSPPIGWEPIRELQKESAIGSGFREPIAARGCIPASDGDS